MDDIMMTGSTEQEVATTQNLLVRHSHARGWEIHLTKFQMPPTSVKCLGSSGTGHVKISLLW